MSLVRWLRKNKTKVMAIVVIVILFSFIGGTTLLQQLDRRRAGLGKAIAYFTDNKKITNYDLILARQDLGILKILGADMMLRNIIIPELSARALDLQALLLGELLFSSQRTSPELLRYIKQTIRAYDYRITSKQINDIYTESIPGDLCWLLLVKEAEQAGIRVSNEASGRLLAMAITQLTPGASYSQLINALVKGVKNQPGIPESKILATFGKLMAVLEYAKMVCSNEDVTIAQIMHNVSLQGETINVEFVKFDSAVFAEAQNQPSQQEISEHFEKYKKFPPGTISDENPYGFGYKLDDRVRLEYIALKLGDVLKIVTVPTQQDAQDFYQQYRNQFAEQVPSDPNDPNSLPTIRTRSYPEVASGILRKLLQDKINSKANQILQETKTLAEAGFDNIGAEREALDAERYRRAAMSADYTSVADQLSKTHKIKIYAGQTGMLSADDIQTDEHLGKLYLAGYGYNLVGLAKIAFAIDEVATSVLGPFDVAKPRMYESIGPLKDVSGINFMQDMSEQIIAIVRVIEAQKASEPESINQTFSQETLRLEQPTEEMSQKIYSVADKVVQDLKKLAAMDTTGSKTEEFIEQTAQDGWDEALDKFNELYGQRKQNEDDPNTFELQKLSNLQRLSGLAKRTLVAQSVGQPAVRSSLDTFEKETLLRNKLYSLVPQDANSPDVVPVVIESRSNMSYYVIKTLSVRRIEQAQYERIKAPQAYKEDLIQYQSLAAVHFNPENILKRMNFRPSEEQEQTTDANTPGEPEGKS